MSDRQRACIYQLPIGGGVFVKCLLRADHTEHVGKTDDKVIRWMYLAEARESLKRRPA